MYDKCTAKYNLQASEQASLKYASHMIWPSFVIRNSWVFVLLMRQLRIFGQSVLWTKCYCRVRSPSLDFYCLSLYFNSQSLDFNSPFLDFNSRSLDFKSPSLDFNILSIYAKVCLKSSMICQLTLRVHQLTSRVYL